MTWKCIHNSGRHEEGTVSSIAWSPLSAVLNCCDLSSFTLINYGNFSIVFVNRSHDIAITHRDRQTKVRCSKCSAHKGIRTSPRKVWQCTARSAGAWWVMSKPLYAALVSLPFCYHNDPHTYMKQEKQCGIILFWWKGENHSSDHVFVMEIRLQTFTSYNVTMQFSQMCYCPPGFSVTHCHSPSASHSPPKKSAFPPLQLFLSCWYDIWSFSYAIQNT